MKTGRSGLSLLAAAVASATLLTATPAARADDTPKEKAPAADTELETHFPPPSTRWKVLGAGVILTGGAWGVAFACAEEWPYVNPTLQPRIPSTLHPLIPSGPPESALLKIPVAGPWIALGHLGCGSDQTTCGPATGARVAAYILDGLVQLAGLALITEGIVMKTETSAPKTSAFVFSRGGFELMPVPVVSPSMSGVGLAGTF